MLKYHLWYWCQISPTNHATTCTNKELEYWESNATLHEQGFIWMIPYTQIVQPQIQVPIFKYWYYMKNVKKKVTLNLRCLCFDRLNS